MNITKFKYNKLRGKIKENNLTLAEFAKKIGITPQSLNNKLNKNIPFTQKEIKKSIDVLNLEVNELLSIFFELEVEKN